MGEEDFLLGENLQSEAHVIAFGTIHPAGIDLRLEQDVPGIEITQPHPPGMLALGQENSAAIVEIKANALWRRLRRRFGRRRIGALWCRA